MSLNPKLLEGQCHIIKSLPTLQGTPTLPYLHFLLHLPHFKLEKSAAHINSELMVLFWHTDWLDSKSAITAMAHKKVPLPYLSGPF